MKTAKARRIEIEKAETEKKNARDVIKWKGSYFLGQKENLFFVNK